MTEDAHIHFESRRTALFAVQQGHGRAVVALHGGLADHRASVHWLEPLVRSCRLTTPDLRGAGRSVYTGTLTWDLLADDVLALLDHLHLDRATIVGLSVGTGVAMRLAMCAPQRVEALVLVNPVYAVGGLAAEQRVAFERMDAFARSAEEDGIEALLPLYADLPEPMRGAALEMARTFEPGSVAATTRFLTAGGPPLDDAHPLAAIAAPTLIVPGDDPLHPRDVALAYASTIPLAVLASEGSSPASSIEPWLETSGLRGVLHLLVGPVGAGKTTLARRRTAESRAVFLDLDTCMVRLFGADERPSEGVLAWYLERRERCRAVLWDVATDTVRSGVDAYLELGLVTHGERADYVERARAARLPLVMHLVDAPIDLRRRRVLERNERGDPFVQRVPPEFFERASEAWEPLSEGERRRCVVHPR